MNMLRELLLIFTLICVAQCELSLSSTEDLYAILNRTTEYFKNLGKILIIFNLNVKITILIYETFLAHDPLNNDTWNNIDNQIATYMNNIYDPPTYMIFPTSKRKKRGLENEPIRGEPKISHIFVQKSCEID